MSLEIKYKNIDGELITSQQLSLMASYFKYYYINNQLKKNEKYGWTSRTDSTMILKGGEYYLDETEDIQGVVSQLVTETTRWKFYYNKVTNSFGDYSYDYIEYEYGSIERTNRYVYNVLNELIAEVSYNHETNEIYNKYKYLRQSYGIESTLVISYNVNDNTILKISDDHDILYDSVDSLLETNPTYNWFAFPYFHNFNSFLPDAPIV